MKTILKYILITLFCISRIKSQCTGTDVTEEACGASCKWTKVNDASCLGDNNGDDPAVACNTFTEEAECTGDCNWAETGTCADKTCTDYKTEDTCKAVSTCEWSNNACATKTPASACTDYKTEDTCKAVSTCEWSNNACATKAAAATCTDYKTEDTCKAVSTCEWSNNACATKAAAATCTDYKTEDTCKAVSTCEWSNNACATKSGTTTTPTTDDDDDGVFCLKSSILIFLLSFLF
jgi:hypothetical protein